MRAAGTRSVVTPLTKPTSSMLAGVALMLPSGTNSSLSAASRICDSPPWLSAVAARPIVAKTFLPSLRVPATLSTHCAASAPSAAARALASVTTAA